MPRETEADRIVKAQVRAQQELQERQRKAEIQAQIDRFNNCMNDIKSEIPVICDLLKQQNYPDPKPVILTKVSRFSSKISREVKAGWEIGSFCDWGGSSEYNSPASSSKVYLLADGRIAYKENAYSVKEIENKERPEFMRTMFFNYWTAEIRQSASVATLSSGLRDLHARLLNPQNPRRP